MTSVDVARPDLPVNSPIRSRTMLLLHEELSRARMRDRWVVPELRSLQLSAVEPPPRRPRVAPRRLRLLLRQAS